MAYPRYTYTYDYDTSAKGYLGPIPIYVGSYDFSSGIADPNDTTEILKASIQRIIMTMPGERVMVPNFGCNLRNLLFEPNDSVLAHEIEESLFFSLSRHEPRINLTSVEVVPYEDAHYLDVFIRYTLKNSTEEEIFRFIVRDTEE